MFVKKKRVILQVCINNQLKKPFLWVPDAPFLTIP
jgi:hypothetical protein